MTRRNMRKTIKAIKTRRNIRKTRKILKGGNSYDKIQVDNFRTMFINAFNALQKAINTNGNVQDAIDKFKKGLKGNKNGINTLIPVNADGLPIDKYIENSGLTSLVPPLVVIFHNIPDMTIRTSLLNAFISINGFNINLTNYVRDTNVLLEALKMQDKPLAELLLRKGADPTMLTEEQNADLQNLLNEPVLNSVIGPETEIKSILKPEIGPEVGPDLETKSKTILKPELEVTLKSIQPSKLNIDMELPSETGYNPEVEPEFWAPIFAKNEMFAIKKLINDIMNLDGTIPIQNSEITRLWSICSIVKEIIPTFYTPIKNNPYMLFDTFFKDSDIDFSKFNIILCSTLIMFGIISYKMIGQDYKIMFKGGKAIQLVLSGISDISEYNSEDIDVLIIPAKNVQYNLDMIKNFAGHLAYLIRWFLTIPENGYNISVLVPNPSNTRANPYIFKLSYIKSVKKYDHRKQMQIDDYKQFSDIDFKELPENIVTYFENDPREFGFEISLSSDTKQNLLFICPNLGAILNEKIYYYTKYFNFKKLLQNKKQITEDGYQTLTIDECQRFLDKFTRAILAINRGLLLQRAHQKQGSDITSLERKSIKKRLENLGYTNEKFQLKVIESLYPLAQAKGKRKSKKKTS
jgi:hypothetical protein